MLLGLIMTTSGMLGLALVENIDDEIYFIYTSALMRLITGIVFILYIARVPHYALHPHIHWLPTYFLIILLKFYPKWR